MEEYIMAIASNPPLQLYQSMAKIAVDVDRFLNQLGMTDPMLRAEYGTTILMAVVQNGISDAQRLYDSAGRGKNPMPGM